MANYYKFSDKARAAFLRVVSRYRTSLTRRGNPTTSELLTLIDLEKIEEQMTGQKKLHNLNKQIIHE